MSADAPLFIVGEDVDTVIYSFLTPIEQLHVNIARGQPLLVAIRDYFATHFNHVKDATTYAQFRAANALVDWHVITPLLKACFSTMSDIIAELSALFVTYKVVIPLVTCRAHAILVGLADGKGLSFQPELIPAYIHYIRTLPGAEPENLGLVIAMRPGSSDLSHVLPIIVEAQHSAICFRVDMLTDDMADYISSHFPNSLSSVQTPNGFPHRAEALYIAGSICSVRQVGGVETAHFDEVRLQRRARFVRGLN